MIVRTDDSGDVSVSDRYVGNTRKAAPWPVSDPHSAERNGRNPSEAVPS